MHILDHSLILNFDAEHLASLKIFVNEYQHIQVRSLIGENDVNEEGKQVLF
jgi:hypothetical protein